jgi:recombination protein RecT
MGVERVTAKADTAPIRAELEQVAQPSDKRDIVDLIRRNKPELEKLLGPSLTVEAFETATMTYLRMNPKLVDCNPYSIVGGLRLGAQLGLSLGPLGHFYLVPFKGEAVFILGYKGMVELAYGSGLVKDVRAEVVRAGDSFTFTYGTTPQLHHTPSGPPGEREWTHVYAVARLKTGGSPFVVLYPEDVEKRKASSPAAKSPYSVWQTHPEDAWRKSGVRALQRWLPQTPESAHGLETDETVPDLLADDVQEVGGEE